MGYGLWVMGDNTGFYFAPVQMVFVTFVAKIHTDFFGYCKPLPGRKQYYLTSKK